jgi:TPP-dependent indolepyruvate ferredoxin oxidoreductase alpha subunit
MTIKEQIKARAEKEYCEAQLPETLVHDENEIATIRRDAYTKGAEDMLPVMEALEQDNARMREALELIQELGMAVASREPFICPGSIEHHIQEIIKKTRKALNQK